MISFLQPKRPGTKSPSQVSRGPQSQQRREEGTESVSRYVVEAVTAPTGTRDESKVESGDTGSGDAGGNVQSEMQRKK